MAIPATFQEFEAAFATEAQCVAYLRQRRFGCGFRCPRCDGAAAWHCSARRLDECRDCGHQTSLTAGTVFHGTRKPLTLWFRVIARFLASKGGCSALEISRTFGLNYETAWTWLHKLRRAMDRSGGLALGGDVEADFVLLDPATGDVRWGTPALLGAIETPGTRRPGRLRFAVAAAASVTAITGFLRRATEDDAILRPNCAGTPVLEGASPEYARVNRAFGLFRRLLAGTYHGGVSARHLQAYADEFVFRFNRRSSESRFRLFDQLLGCAFRKPPTKRELFGGTPNLWWSPERSRYAM